MYIITWNKSLQLLNLYNYIHYVHECGNTPLPHGVLLWYTLLIIVHFCNTRHPPGSAFGGGMFDKQCKSKWDESEGDDFKIKDDLKAWKPK